MNIIEIDELSNRKNRFHLGPLMDQEQAEIWLKQHKFVQTSYYEGKPQWVREGHLLLEIKNGLEHSMYTACARILKLNDSELVISAIQYID